MSSIKEEIVSTINNSPDLPGCYIWKDAKGRILYVGKAKSLRNRLKSYLREDLPYKIKIMVRKASSLEIITTDNEVNAYILEQNLIKTHKPTFNTLLKDDKSYPYLKIAIKEEFPYVMVTRKPQKDGSIYLGPYPNANALREAIRILLEAFPLRQCKKDIKKLKFVRPCLKYQIGRCYGPCGGKITKEEYWKIVNGFLNFIKGDVKEYVEKLEQEMFEASENLDFERAIVLRDRIKAIQELLETQKVMLPERINIDVITGVEKDGISVVNVTFVRNGMVIGEKMFVEIMPVRENIFNAVFEVYSDRKDDVEYILTDDGNFETLKEVMDNSFKIRVKKAESENENILMEFVSEKTKRFLEDYILEEGKWMVLSRELKEKLNLNRLPNRIEGYDMSNLSGDQPVGSMVVFIDGKEAKSEYRRFAIKEAPKRADIYMHEEVIRRRLEHEEWEYPDLIILDGTLAHVRRIRKILRDRNLDIDVIAISESKDHDRIWNEEGEVIIDTSNPVFLFIQKVRDEAHRFALSYQRKRREMNFLK